jgi:excinuclease ABC subunit C
MQKEQLKNLNLPEEPGVYFFLGSRKEILYIGKATNLKSRVRSYFATDLSDKRSPLIENMVLDAATLEYTITPSVLEALILETNLIRTHKPRFNTKSKDDKSYNRIVITNEEWPRLLVVRERDLAEKFLKEDIKYEFGPYPSSSLLRDSLKIIRKLFRFYDTKKPVDANVSKVVRGQIDFNRQIGLYPELTDKVEYLRTIRHLKLFFQGKKLLIIKELEREMNKSAKSELFEDANKFKKQIFSLKHIEDVSLIKADRVLEERGFAYRIEAYDVAHMDGKNMVGVMVVVQNSESRKSEYRKFKIKTLNDANDPAALKEILRRRLNRTEWPLPQIIVVDGNEVQINAAKSVLSELNLSITVVSVVKDDKHTAAAVLAPQALLTTHKFDILLANAEAHRFAINFHRNLARKRNLPEK